MRERVGKKADEEDKDEENEGGRRGWKDGRGEGGEEVRK